MFVSSLDWASHKIVKHYANSNLARIVSVTKSSPRSPTLQFQMSISRYSLTENYLTIWAWSKMGWGGWRVESDQSATKRVQSAAWQPGLCDWGQWGESVSPCCLSSSGLRPPASCPAAPCSLTNILHVQQQIKTDQADCYRSYTAQGWSLDPGCVY